MARRSSKKRAPIEPVYPKLVALGKSTELLSEQLQTACTILGLTEEQLQWIAAFDESQIQDHASLRASSFYGQEEYVLRWLLGKLQAGGDGGLQARSSSKAWTLLQYLIQVLPPVNAARLMKGIKFLQVVEQALRELASSSPALSTTKPQNGPGGSNSDSTVRGDSMELGSPASSRKRKRNGSPSSRPEASKHQSVSDETSHRIIYVLNYICDLSNSANIGFGSNHEPYALEHMKSLLRTDLETAAKVFGCSMRLLLSELPIVRGPADVSKQSQRKSLLRGGFAVWRQRSKESDDAQDDRSNHAFATHCLVPALLVLRNIQGMDDAASSIIISSLEQLLNRHVLSPSETAFHEHFSPRAKASRPQSVMLDTKIYTRYFDPLRFTTGSTERLFPEEDSHLLETIPNLLSVALGPSARGPVLRSSAAASWHQTLFKSLVEFAGLQMATGGDQEVEQAQVNVLDQLLQIAADSRINLETELLSALVASFSGILALGEGKVHWPLVEKVLLLDANVFLIPQSQSDDSSSINNLTKALFRQITLLGQGARASYKDYDRVQQRVLSPLMGEFAKARDLLGFLRYWREELEFLGEARFAQSQLDESSATTLFENDGVRRDLRALLEQNLTTGQISEAIEEASQSLNLEQSSPQLKARAFAGMVILDNIVGSLTGYETADTLADVLLKTFQLVSSHVVSGVWDERIRWRLWRTLARLNGDVLVDTLGTILRDIPEAERLKLRGFIQDVLKKVGQAMDEVTLSSWRVPIKPEIYSEAFEAFDFICKFTTQNARVLDLERPAFDLTEDLIRRLNLFIQGGLEASVPLIKQNDLQLGGQRVFRSPAAWAVSMLVLLISNHSAILLRASTKLRQGFIQNITDVIGMTAGSDLPAAFQGVVTQDLQAVILNSESIVNSASLKGDLVDAILERLRAHRKQDALGILAVEGLLELPGQTMNRAQREEILNKIVEDANTHHFNNSRSVAQKQISLMVKLMQMPNASSNLVAEAESLWSLAATLEVVDQQEGPRFDDDTRRGFEQLVRLVLKHHLSNPAQERSQRYLTSSHRRLIETISKTRSFSDNLLNLGLIKASEDTLWPLDHDLAKTNGVESLESVHEEYLEILYSDLTGLRGCLRNGHSSNNEVILEEILDAVVAAVQLRAPADIHDLVDELQAVFGPTQVNRTHRHRHHRIEIRCFVALAELYDPNDSEDDAEADELYLLHRIANYSNNRLQTSDRKQVLKALRCNAERVNDEQRVSLIQSLRDDISKAKGDMSENLVLLRAMIPSITDQPTISSIHTTLTNALPTTDTTRAFLLASASIIEILTTKHRSITQWMIESTLTAIVLTSTNLSHPTCQNAKHSIMAYTRLCKILSTILTAHRVRLRGRFHLVLQVLRALLRRLFPSSASSTSSTTSASSPPPPLPPSAAQSFTSLLMALCDPTVSSVTTGSTASRKNRGGQALTPATDKAAHLAGQYLPYLLLEYVSCQLRAPLGADVRAALAPGLYAILDVVPVETRRMLGAACDAEGRAVLRALWEEWLVLGEGRGEHDDDEGRERGHRRR